MRPDPAAARERGFTLLEVAIAFVIAALALGVMFDAVLGGLHATQNAGQYQEAMSLARSHIAAAAAGPLTRRDAEGDDGRGFHWAVHVAPAGSATLPRNPDDDPGTVPAVQVTLYAISVVESWHAGHAARQVRLETARLAPGKPKGG